MESESRFVRPTLVFASANAITTCIHNERLGMRTMGSLVAPRRQFLRGLASLAVCAPAVVRASTLMGVSARFCEPYHDTPPWAADHGALALLQHEMERRFAETVFGAENLSAQTENSVLTRSPVVAEAKLTALWELRTLFGPRGSPPKSLEDLPAEVRAGLASMFGSHAGGRSSDAPAAGFSSFAARESGLPSI
jgi:hypothetical protein